jgi:predicted Rossmann-fold nucleotide-binding protein
MSFINDMPHEVIQDDGDYTIIVRGHVSKPEFKATIPENAKFLLATTGTHKKEDWDRVTRNHAPGSRLMGAFLYSEDSREEENNAVDIAIGKIDVSISRSFNEASARDIEEAFRVNNIAQDAVLIDVADDRSMRVDPRLRDYEEFQAYKDYPLVREVFEVGSPWPNHRIKELYDLMGGPIEFLGALERAYQKLPEIDPVKYADLSQEVQPGFAVAFRAHDPEQLPALKNGVVIEVLEKKTYFKFPTPEQIKVLKKSGEYANANLDMFQYMEGETQPYSKLRENEGNSYFDTRSGIAKVWEQFTRIFDVPKLARPRALHPKMQISEPSILTNSPLPVSNSLPVLGKPDVTIMNSPFRSLADIESATSEADAVLLQQPARIASSRKPSRHAPERKLLAKIEPLTVLFQTITHKGLHDRRYTGRPLVVHTALKPLVTPFMEALYLRKTMHAKPSEMITNMSDVSASHLRRTLIWDPRTYTSPEDMVEAPAHILPTLDDITAVTGIQDFGFSYSMIGSATSGLPAGCQAAYSISYEAAKHGMTQVNGGGTRYGTIMGEMFRGAVKAHDEVLSEALAKGLQGADLKEKMDGLGKVLGFRVPIASRKEGSLKNFREKTGLPLTKGDMESKYRCFADLFHFVTLDTLAARQHPINGMGDVQIVLPGGAGTMYEMFSTVLHNLNINVYGHGMYPGVSDKKIPIIVVNSKVNGSEDNRYYNFLKEIFTPQELEMMGIEFVKDEKEAFERMQYHKQNAVQKKARTVFAPEFEAA